MKRQVSMEEISDGKLYTLNDMVKAGCNDCKGCSACCQGMGSSIVLDPLDVYRLCKNLGQTFEQLLVEKLELQVVDGIVLPNLKMVGEKEQCAFLNAEGRCSIHAFRPGICRLFPLGRYYENGTFQYFLQVHECKNQNRTKVKVRKWIDTPDVAKYEKFVADWHFFLVDLQEGLEKQPDENERKRISMGILKDFYLKAFDTDRDFYEQFEERKNAFFI
ncbi:MAG: YkgJ family cysteine cluster protein [Lachnospiraceae bacterium]|nr:YkgJ family cysteine cluster protein [Lachnospiraceae bacterium]